ncbi:MAG: DinB family protein [Acidobacteria bacterium]|nr:DinB family protein [Acidobacteriota bacterium]
MTVQSKLEETLAARWEQAGGKLTQLAAELPAAKWNSAAVKGARTWAEVLRHVAYWNLYLAATLRGEKGDDSANEIPAAEYATKETILAALSQSFDSVSKAWRQRDAQDAQATESMLAFLEHNAEHYGQLVVYARLAGIVPPASRG